MQGFLQQTTSDDYREELAKERFETERLFIRKVLMARKEAKIRRRAERGWLIVRPASPSAMKKEERR